jgi:translocation and assembly module TamB
MALAEGRYTGEVSPLEELMHIGRRGGSARNVGTSFTLWSEGPLASAELDVHLGGARTFEYRTNLLSASLRPDAWLRGTGAFPVLEGPVYVEAASLTLPSGELELTSGLLTFRRDAPLNPELALTAEMRVQRHDVRAVVSGALDGQRDFQIVLSSTPPLPPDDLWILVLTGQLPQSRWQDRSSQAMEALALFLARDSLVRWFGSDPDDTQSLLERFEIDVGAETSRSGQPTGRVVFYLKPQVRRSGRATYLSAEIDEYDRVNYAFGIVFRPR